MDHAMNIRQELIASASSEVTAEQYVDAVIARLQSGNQAKLIRAKNIMGDRWVYHPNYNAKATPHHNCGHKGSAVLSAFLNFSGAIARGRV